MDVILYSTNCPRCNVIEKKLKSKNINFDIISDTKLMEQKGFTFVPKLEVNGTVMDFKNAVEWINNMQEND